MSQKEKIQEDIHQSEQFENKKSLFLYNDDVNTFDYVIETLISVCDHDPAQAEQCTLIAHYRGKCEIKCGTQEELLPYYRSLLERQLTVEIY